ncbi:hypothetical protein QJQ45_017930 [Haematococcus lacustris]|nr:hypothetical protein QJQ45_017930 [Haematococcus lacustris]
MVYLAEANTPRCFNHPVKVLFDFEAGAALAPQPFIAMTHSAAIVGTAIISLLGWLLLRPSRARRHRRIQRSASTHVVRVPRYSSLKKSQSNDISVVSWNVLADTLATPKRLPWVSHTVLAWQQRAPMLAEELRTILQGLLPDMDRKTEFRAPCTALRRDADIVALQEVDRNRRVQSQPAQATAWVARGVEGRARSCHRWPEVQGWLPGHQGLLQQRSGGGASGAMLLALMWKPHLQLEWSEHRTRALIAQFSWTPTASLPSVAKSGAADIPGDAASSLHQPVDDTAGTQTLWVVNLHLEGSPYRPNDRVNQLRSALQRLAARQEFLGLAPNTCPVLLLGDFNSGRHESCWRLLHT